MRRSFLCFIVAVILGCCAHVGSAQIGADVSYTSTQLGPTQYQYTFTVHNTGTTDIGTFWVAWTPASLTFYPYDLLPSAPTVTASPTGWAGLPERDGIGGYAIEWYDLGTAIPSGGTSSNFTFTSADPPSTLSSPSPYFGLYPANTSWVYIGSVQSGQNLQDQGVLISPAAVPEPAMLLSPLVLLGLGRRRAHSKTA